MLEVKAGATTAGRTVYDDGVARIADLGEDQFSIACAGHSVKCHALDLVDAGVLLIRRVGGKLSILEAVRVALEDIESRLPAE
jgi:hypothetical protein